VAVKELLAPAGLSEQELRVHGPTPAHRVAEIGAGVLAALRAAHESVAIVVVRSLEM
jgi:hypothetical protein